MNGKMEKILRIVGMTEMGVVELQWNGTSEGYEKS